MSFQRRKVSMGTYLVMWFYVLIVTLTVALVSMPYWRRQSDRRICNTLWSLPTVDPRR